MTIPPDPGALPRTTSRQGRIAMGKALRKLLARSEHAPWQPASDRRDPIDALREADLGRVPHLLHARYSRMLASPLAFFRGAGSIMAGDLAGTPTTGIRVQASGDAQLANFAGFRIPDGRVLFDFRRFDETLPAPWEWDIKRLATSALVAGRCIGLGRKASRDAATAAVRGYREQMLGLAGQRELEAWYGRMDASRLIEFTDEKAVRRRLRKSARKRAAPAPLPNDEPRVTATAEDRHRIRERPPFLHHGAGEGDAAILEEAARVLTHYRATLPGEQRLLLERFTVVDAAIDAMGIGALGSRSIVVLLMADDDDPLVLQVREARRSVLEPSAGPGTFLNQGERIVAGQRLIQAAPDPFLGWAGSDAGRHYYVRLLQEAKLRPAVDRWDGEALDAFAEWCGWVLARAHARSGDAAVMAGYLGQGDAFDRAVTAFAQEYAEQNERDYQAFVVAAAEGRVEAAETRPPVTLP